MKLSVLCSLILHLAILGLVFQKASNIIEETVSSQVQLISLKEEVVAQKKRVRGSAPRVQTLKKKINKSSTQEIEKVGNDSVDAEEIKISQGIQALQEVATYGQELKEYLEKNRYYPHRAKLLEQTGVVKVRFKINPDGSFAQVEILEVTKHNLLNDAAKSYIAQLKNFKPLPDSYKGNGVFVVDIHYKLQGAVN